MSMASAARKIARAIDAAPRRHHEEEKVRYRGELVRWRGEDDFRVDLHGEDLRLDEDDVTLGQTVRRYNADTGLRRGDALILLELGEGDFVAVDVESDT